jgi:DNA-binding transcriptional MerR regulator
MIQPQTSERGDRVYREYRAEDVTQLKQVANLRKACFTLSEIRQMQQAPDAIAEVLTVYQTRIEQEAQGKQSLARAVAALDFSKIHTIGVLAEQLSKVTVSYPLPTADIRLNFGRFDPEEPDKEETYQRFLDRQQRLYERGRVLVWLIAGINVALTLVSCFLGAGRGWLSVIIQTILSIALAMGVRWVQYLFIVGAGLGAAVGIWTIASLAVEGELTLLLADQPFLIFLLIFQLIEAISAGWILLKSESVREFLYRQRNG